MQSIRQLLRLSMVKTLHIIRSAYFPVCTLFAFALSFSTGIYTDAESNQTYCVIEILLAYSKRQMDQKLGLYAPDVFSNGIGTYVAMFIPILVSLPYVFGACNERKSGYLRYKLVRVSYLRYLLSDCVSAFLSAGIMACLGYVLYGMVVFALFPLGSISSFSAMLSIILKVLASIFLFGVVAIVPSLFLVSVMENEYVILTIPFVLFYFENVLVKKLFSKGFQCFNAYTLEMVPWIYYLEEWIRVLLFHGGMILLSSLGYIILQKRRFDYGQ